MIKIGHRGAAGYETENSLRSFAKAIELKVDVIELDVQVCKSGEPVVFHYKILDKITNGSGKISKKSLNEIKRWKLANGEKIPTLEEALDLIDKRVALNIELKGKKSAKPVHKVIARYIKEKKWPKDFFYISSFNRKEIKDFRKIDAGFKIGYLVSGKRLGMYFGKYNFAKKNQLYSLNVYYKKINKKLVFKVHQKGLKVFAWPVNEKKDIEKMKNLNVDGIISDFPDRI